MCPACLTTTALVVAGATSAGGLTALAVKKLRIWTGAKVIVTVRATPSRDRKLHQHP